MKNARGMSPVGSDEDSLYDFDHEKGHRVWRLAGGVWLFTIIARYRHVGCLVIISRMTFSFSFVSSNSFLSILCGLS